MKVTLVVLSLACFIGALHALPLNEEFQGAELEPQTFPNFEELSEEDEAFRPVPKPVRPPQIHHNSVRAQGPFSGNLVNVVANKQGFQKTAQKNRIEYNINTIRKALDELLEDNDNE